MSSLVSLIIVTVVGLTQFRIKRLFAYSTISLRVFILLALSINSIESCPHNKNEEKKSPLNRVSRHYIPYWYYKCYLR